MYMHMTMHDHVLLLSASGERLAVTAQCMLAYASLPCMAIWPWPVFARDLHMNDSSLNSRDLQRQVVLG